MKTYILLLPFILLVFIQSCKKCEGELPQFSQVEKETLPQIPVDSIVVFKSGNDFDTFKIQTQAQHEFENGTMYNPLGRKPCPEEMTLFYSYSLVKPIPGSVYPRRLFQIGIKKSHVNFDKYISAEGYALDNTTLIENIPSIYVNGKVYENIDIYSLKRIGDYEQADTVFIAGKSKIVKFHSNHNRYWESVE